MIYEKRLYFSFIGFIFLQLLYINWYFIIQSNSHINYTFYRDFYNKVLSLILFMIRNKNQLQVNSEIHQINTRQHANLHQPSVNATKYQKGIHCIGVKVFNMLPFYIKAEVDDQKKFKSMLQKYLCENSFYSLDEYFECQVKF